MKILYLTINEDIHSAKSGVSNKLNNKVEAIHKYSGSCLLLNAKMSTENDSLTELQRGNLYRDIEIGVKSEFKGWMNSLKADIAFYDKLAAYIEQNKFSPDRIIMRYPYASKGLLRLSKKFNKKIVFEHNTKETEEIKIQTAKKKFAPFSIRPSEFFFWLREKKLPLYYEKTVGPEIFKHAHSGACVTTEIANYEKHRNESYHTFVSSNFYDVKETSLIQKSYDPGKEQLHFGMIVSTMAPWYGLERLLRSFSKFQNEYKLILAGIDPGERELQALLNKYGISQNLEIVGKIEKNKLPEFYSRVHLCFGSLGLFKIGLNYASTLKVKESVSCGIPVAIGYLEEDFQKHESFKPYYFQLSNDDSEIDFRKLQAFAAKFYSEAVNQEKLRQLALDYLDVRVKVKQLVDQISE